jgi:rhamnogalacturonyl hydrolase YesR
MRKVADYEISRTKALPPDGGWVRASLYTGVLAAYRATGEVRYLDAALKWADAEAKWAPWGTDQRFADNLCCGQVFTELYEIRRDPLMLSAYRAAIDNMMASPRQGREDWWWCDALYMAPPGIARLGAITGDRKYFAFLNEMFWDSTDFLFNKGEGLYYRDKNYFSSKTRNGKPVFWSRGNGWVMGGTVRVLQYLPADDPGRPRFVQLHQQMARALARCQGEDGLWRPNLGDADEYPIPETSGTAFDCYAIAWGINNGLLDRENYLPVARRAWRGLVACVGPEGRLGYVQPVGGAPGPVTPGGTQEYAVGAFLLAGSEMARLDAMKFDMGAAGAENGYIPVQTEVWTPARGYGWLDPGDLVLRDRKAPDLLRRDYLFGHKPATFRVNVAPGPYRVTLISGDMDYGDHETQARVNGVQLPILHPRQSHFATLTTAIKVTGDRLDIAFSSPRENWVINAITIEPAAGPEAPRVTDQSFAAKAADPWINVAKTPDAIAPYLKRFRTQLAAKPAFRPTGLGRKDYLKLIAGNVDFFRKHQNKDGAIIDPYRRVEFQYSTPCFALAAATLVVYGGRKDLLEPAAKAMDWATLTLSQGRAATHHEDFFSEQIGHAMPLFRPLVSKARYAKWQAQIAGFDPYKVYRAGIGGNNWNVVALSGEWLFHRLGLRPDTKYIAESLTAQGKSFSSSFGLYLEGPMAYDHFPRLWAADMVSHGYNGVHARDLAEMLRRGAITSLFMQSPTGELPAGGRSAHHQWNEAEQACTYEIYAARALKDGDKQMAGVFKRAAHLALASMKRWMRPSGEMQIVKNWVNPSAQHGYEGYSSHSQYNLLPMAMLSIVYLHSGETEAVKEQPAPADLGGFVLQIDPALHKVFANASGMYVEVDTNADSHYEPTGLLRIHKSGFNPQLGPSQTLSTAQVYLPKGPSVNAAVGVAWKDVNGGWRSLAEYTNNSLSRMSLLGVEESPKSVAFQLLDQGYFSGPVFISEKYTITPDSVLLRTETPDYAGPLRYVWPVLADDGKSKSSISVKNGAVSVTLRGETQTYTPVGASAISVGKTLYPFRNGWARVVTAEYPRGGAISLRIAPKARRSR